MGRMDILEWSTTTATADSSSQGRWTSVIRLLMTILGSTRVDPKFRNTSEQTVKHGMTFYWHNWAQNHSNRYVFVHRNMTYFRYRLKNGSSTYFFGHWLRRIRVFPPILSSCCIRIQKTSSVLDGNNFEYVSYRLITTSSFFEDEREVCFNIRHLLCLVQFSRSPWLFDEYKNFLLIIDVSVQVETIGRTSASLRILLFL